MTTTVLGLALLGEVDDMSNADVRVTLQSLISLIDDHGPTVITITDLNTLMTMVRKGS